MKYLTVAETLLQNGDRHAGRALEHIAAGHPDYAAGSLRKAQRNWERARLFGVPAWMLPFTEELAKQVAAQILRGR